MLQTFIALIAAHVFADFLLQVKWIIRNKRHAGGFTVHALIVAMTAVLTLGAFSSGARNALLAVALVTATHAIIDSLKLWLSGRSWICSRHQGELNLFLADQAAHIAMLALVAFWLPAAWQSGFWASALPQLQPTILTGLCLAAGFILTTRTGEFAIRFFMRGISDQRADNGPRDTAPVEGDPNDLDDPGLTDGGTWIGLLERALIFLLVMLGQFNAIGFLITAKSILRFQYANEHSHSEVVIIGTLASFGWAILFSWLTATGVQLIG